MSLPLTDARVVVIGAGASGLGAAELLHARGARVVVSEVRTAAELGEPVRVLAAKLGDRLELALGGHSPDLYEGAALVVISPGVPPHAEWTDLAARGVEVIGEVELAARLLTAPLVAITGTNGKSTVTTLVGDMLARTGMPTFVGGNLGRALSHAVGGEADVVGGRVVAELSSFQLEAVKELRPKVAALLNVTPDHLDRYPTYEAYARTKARIFEAQGKGDHAVLPSGEMSSRGLAPRSPADGGPTLHEFGVGGEVHVERGDIVDRETGWRFPLEALRLAGQHNATNACAAVLIARLAGASGDAMSASLREFTGLPHRAALVRRLEDVDYVDDSKATNVGAAVAALDGLASPSRRAVLIAGGVDKGGSYAPLKERMMEVGRAIVLIGEAAPLIAEAMRDAGLPIARAPSLEDAVARARELAAPGDLVLLAPACSSFDMFKSYAHRGDEFVRAVNALEAR
ncbi:MAG: UDP-N-acetylmuramoyl-L-alanine--D-glutamate ligase [Sandaracinaceae bacterium]